MDEPQMRMARGEEPIWKDLVLQDSNSMTFQKRQNQRQDTGLWLPGVAGQRAEGAQVKRKDF